MRMRPPYRSLPRLAWAATLAAVTSCATPNLPAPSPRDESLLGSRVDAARDAILRWDFEGLTNAARRLHELDVDDEREAYARVYWRGAALFHAVLVHNESGAPGKVPARAAEDALGRLLSTRPNDADGHAMLATLYGLTIAAKPAAALRLGPRLTRHRRAAARAEPPSPRARYLDGVGRLNRARDADAVSAALDVLLEAEKLFEAESQRDLGRLDPDWGRPHNGLFIGEAYEKMGRPDQALAWFERAGRAAPGSARAREGIKRCKAKTEKKSL